MNFPEKYISRGEFTLHSGEKSDRVYDVVSAITDPEVIQRIMGIIPKCPHYVGILSGGGLMAQLISRRFRSKISYVHDGELKGSVPENDWFLIDDVTTTGSSLREAIRIVGSQPKEIYVAVDRRGEEREKLKIHSIFSIT